MRELCKVATDYNSDDDAYRQGCAMAISLIVRMGVDKAALHALEMHLVSRRDNTRAEHYWNIVHTQIRLFQ